MGWGEASCGSRRWISCAGLPHSARSQGRESYLYHSVAKKRRPRGMMIPEEESLIYSSLQHPLNTDVLHTNFLVNDLFCVRYVQVANSFPQSPCWGRRRVFEHAWVWWSAKEEETCVANNAPGCARGAAARVSFAPGGDLSRREKDGGIMTRETVLSAHTHARTITTRPHYIGRICLQAEYSARSTVFRFSWRRVCVEKYPFAYDHM